MDNQELYNALIALRGRLKEEGKRKTGRAPLVCNDEALEYIAEMQPKKIADLEGVPGIGRTFIDNYGDAFIEVVKDYVNTDAEKTIEMNTNATETLRELEKKLVSINRRNRLLYMPKLAGKYAYDVAQKMPEGMIDVLFGSRNSFELCNLAIADPLEGKRFKNAVSLIREINKDLRDKGQNDLYVGYPFVIGRIPGENFDVRCPLTLFPVKVNRTSTQISVMLDDSRDIVYNGTLILAYYKFNNINSSLPDMVLEKADIKSFLGDLLDFYENVGIHIEYTNNTLTRYKDYSSGEFPHYKAGELFLEQNIVLGKFPVCSSSIQQDFDAMIETGQINNLLNELLLDVNDWDYETDSYFGDSVSKDNYEKYEITEKKLTYINDLDSSQENVLSAISEMDKLVVQGPPGTGKSQVITSLIAKFVNEGKTVLLVSEKKTALDVVYSRLGSLAKYALLIDDIGNKELFYNQLEKMVHLGRKMDENIENVDSLSVSVDSKIRELEKIAEKLYTIGDFGIEPYKLYIKHRNVHLENPDELNLMKKIHGLLNPEIRRIQYAELSEIYQRFNNLDFCERLVLFSSIIKRYSWIKEVKTGLGQLELLDFETDYQQYYSAFDEYSHKNFLAKIWGKLKIKKMAKEFSQKYFGASRIEKLLLSNPKEVLEGFRQYDTYDNNLTLYEQLTQNEKIYLNILGEISDLYTSLLDASAALYNAIIYENIIEFEANNKDVLLTIDQYRNVIHDLSELIEKKKNLTRSRLESILNQNIGNISYAKRSGEINRVIEGKRKWSVNRFIRKFSFELFKGVKIWLLTPEVVSEIIPLETGIFDLVIFDEASQMYVEKGLPSIYRAKKVIIAGDHKQLRPSSLGSGRLGFDEEELPIDEDISAALDEESLLDLARFKYQDVMLNYHYRAKYEELIAFSNHAFYKGRLYVSPNVDTPKKSPIEYHQMNNAIWSNRANIVEAKYIVAMLKDILRDRSNAETIGIITFNSNQRDLILDIIDEQCAIDVTFATQIRAEMSRERDGEDIGLFVKNIESVQGDERDIIIFSIGYAKNENGRLIRNFGWLNQKGGENRLNVAISRAKQKVHVVASFDPEELQVEDSKNDGPRILKKYLQYSKAISSGNLEYAQQILMSFGDGDTQTENIRFDSDFEIQVYDCLNDKLSCKGYTVDTQVGIGGYSVDLAIKKNGKYLLGIECDGRTYHSSKSARERDYHRQKYLESRGWRIHRIWSTNWWKNPTREIEKICTIVESL